MRERTGVRFAMSRKWTSEVLPGLPAYGPMAEPFSATGRGKHREGLVLRFTSEAGESWVGNFQRSGNGIDYVVDHPNGSSIVVIAGGQAYTVDPESRQCLGCHGHSIEFVHPVHELE